MRIRTTRKAIYAVTAIAALALVGGFAAATIGLGGPTHQSYQGSQATTVSNVQGLNWTSTSLSAVESNFTGTSCAAASPCSVTTSNALDCAGGVAGATTCVMGDFVEQVVLSTVNDTAFPGTLNITLYVSTAAATYTGTSFYYTQTSTTNTDHTITLDFGIGTVGGVTAPVTAVDVVING